MESRKSFAFDHQTQVPQSPVEKPLVNIADANGRKPQTSNPTSSTPNTSILCTSPPNHQTPTTNKPLQFLTPQIALHSLHRTLPLSDLHCLPPPLHQYHRPPPRLKQILPLQLLERPLPLHLPLHPVLPNTNRHHTRRCPLLRRRQRPSHHHQKGP